MIPVETLSGIMIGLPVGYAICRALVVRPLLRILNAPGRDRKGQVDKTDVESFSSSRWGTQNDFSPEILRALAYWVPPRGGKLQLFVSVHLGGHFLFYSVKPNDSPDKIVWNLDLIAHSLLTTEEPELTEEWAHKLDATLIRFEEKLFDG